MPDRTSDGQPTSADAFATDQAFTANTLHSTSPESTYAGALSFLRRRFRKELDGVDVAVVGVPLDLATTNRPGARFGPGAIRAASAIMSYERPYGCPLDPREALAIVDYGDLPFDFGRPAEIPGRIEQGIAAILARGVTPLVLGGDHYISLPVLRAIRAAHGPVCLIHFDAHTDTWDEGDGQVYNHGTMFRRAVEEGLLDVAHSAQVGIRTHNPDTMGFPIFDAPWVHAHGAAATVERIRESVGARKAYVTFDIDCLDPSFAPGTGTPVSGGLTSAQAIAILRGLAGLEVIGGDVVEVAPAYDIAQITALAGAHVAYELLALFAQRG